MLVGERQQRAPAAQPDLEAEGLEGRQQAVARDGRRARLERKRQPAPYTSGVAGSSSAETISPAARAPNAASAGDHTAHQVVSRQQLHEGADDERIARRVAQRGANPHEVSGTELDDRRDHRIGGRRGRLDRSGQIRRPAERRARSRPAMLRATVKSAIEYSTACSRCSPWRRSPPSSALTYPARSRRATRNSPAAASATARLTATNGCDGARPTSTRISTAPAPFPAQSHATSMSDLAERFVASANGV